MRRRAVLLAAALAGNLLALPALAAGEIPVVTSISILSDIVRNVGGVHVAVIELIGPDADAHVFEPPPPTPRRWPAPNRRGQRAGSRGLARSPDRCLRLPGVVVVASQGVVPREMDEGGDTVSDPHAWQDLANGSSTSKASHAGWRRPIRRTPPTTQPMPSPMCARSPRTWTAGAGRAGQGAGRPAQGGQLHDAFGYFGAAYGVEPGPRRGYPRNPERSAADLKQTIDQIRAQHIKVLFLENALSPRLIEQIARETGAAVGGTLYADALSPPGGPADTYLNMFRHNVPLLRDAMLASGGQG